MGRVSICLRKTREANLSGCLPRKIFVNQLNRWTNFRPRDRLQTYPTKLPRFLLVTARSRSGSSAALRGLTFVLLLVHLGVAFFLITRGSRSWLGRRSLAAAANC